MESPDIIKLHNMEGQIKKTLSADDIIRDAHEKALLYIGEQYNKDDDVRSQRSNALISPVIMRKNYEDDNKKVRDEARKKREEKRIGGLDTDTGSLRVHENTQHKPLSIADLKEMRRSHSNEPAPMKSPDVIKRVMAKDKEKKERKEKRREKKRREPMKEEQLIEMKKVVLQELSDSQLLKIIERKRSITVKNPIFGELIQPTNPIFKEKPPHTNNNNAIAIEVKPALETLKEVKNPIFGLSLPGHNKHEEITTLSPRSRSSSESRKTSSNSSSTNTSPRSSVNGDIISRTKSEEGRRSPISTIRIGSRGNSRSNSNADETTQPTEILIHPGYSTSNLKVSSDTGSEITWSKEQQKQEEIQLSATTQAKVEAMKLYMNEYYWSLFHYLNDRQQRLNDLRQNLNKSQMLQYAEFFNSESEQLRKRRVRLKILDFQHLATIGKGGFGNVFLVRHKASGGTFALKRMGKSTMNQKNQIERILTEKEVLSKTVESPWLVHLHSSFQDADHFYLVMEYVPGGDLASMLTNIGPIPQQDAVFYIAEMILAVSALHKMGYIHRDLKPGNFLIDGKGHIKLADFGLSKKGMKDLFRNTLQIKNQSASLKRLDSVREFQKRSQYYIENRNKQLAYSIVGSCDYMALELVMGQGYDFAVDWWSIGAIMFEFILGVPPFFAESPAEVFSNVLEYNRVLSDWEATFAEQPEKPMDDVCWNFIKSLLSPPENRLGHDRGAEEILAHPLFKDVNTRTIRETTAPFVPQLSSDTDLSYFDREGLEEEVLPLSPSFKPLHQHVEGFTFKMPSTLNVSSLNPASASSKHVNNVFQ